MRVVQSGHSGGIGASNNVALRKPEPPRVPVHPRTDTFPPPDAITALVTSPKTSPRSAARLRLNTTPAPCQPSGRSRYADAATAEP